jgi:hypothetical protein
VTSKWWGKGVGERGIESVEVKLGYVDGASIGSYDHVELIQCKVELSSRIPNRASGKHRENELLRFVHG